MLMIVLVTSADGPHREPPADGADRTGICVDDTGADGAHRRGTGT